MALLTRLRPARANGEQPPALGKNVLYKGQSASLAAPVAAFFSSDARASPRTNFSTAAATRGALYSAVLKARALGTCRGARGRALLRAQHARFQNPRACRPRGPRLRSPAPPRRTASTRAQTGWSRTLPKEEEEEEEEEEGEMLDSGGRSAGLGEPLALLGRASVAAAVAVAPIGNSSAQRASSARAPSNRRTAPVPAGSPSPPQQVMRRRCTRHSTRPLAASGRCCSASRHTTTAWRRPSSTA
ncbi:unnamed protein product [Prorocentrum cordatum]|uniref:Uncharacterized protein n=1 Tax=Prorocentrum cordatum TaxID=2364126 RepID=A0ABN9T3Z2_9DINO|nr:unnamed protein product [Polarella glacialis]